MASRTSSQNGRLALSRSVVHETDRLQERRSPRRMARACIESFAPAEGWGTDCDARYSRPKRLPATTAATTTAAATVLARTRFVDAEGATTHVLAVERGDRLLGVLIAHLDEPEAAGALGFAIERHGNRDNLAMNGEELPKLIFGCAKGHVSNINLLSQRLTLLAGQCRH